MTTPVLERTQPHGALRAGDRWLAALCLLVSAGTHLPLVPEHLAEARYIGIGFLLLALASVALALALAVRDTVAVWVVVAAVEALALTAYVASRTVGLPLLSDDVGRWLDPWSFPAIAAELIALATAAGVLVQRRALRAHR
jgi:hypothetical protein